MSLKSPALASGFFTTRATQEAHLVTPNNEVPLTVPLPQHTHTHTQNLTITHGMEVSVLQGLRSKPQTCIILPGPLQVSLLTKSSGY